MTTAIIFQSQAGLSYQQGAWKAFASCYSLASKEPKNRDDFEKPGKPAAPAEKLERPGDRRGKRRPSQQPVGNALLHAVPGPLVLTGKINDVGAYTRTNIPPATGWAWNYRKPAVGSQLRLTGNLTLSQNKVMDFSEYIDDYDLGGQQRKTYRKTDLAYSPDLVGAATFSYQPVSQLELSLVNKYGEPAVSG